jgi:hypothetical protein
MEKIRDCGAPSGDWEGDGERIDAEPIVVDSGKILPQKIQFEHGEPLSENLSEVNRDGVATIILCVDFAIAIPGDTIHYVTKAIVLEVINSTLSSVKVYPGHFLSRTEVLVRGCSKIFGLFCLQMQAN